MSEAPVTRHWRRLEAGLAVLTALILAVLIVGFVLGLALLVWFTVDDVVLPVVEEYWWVPLSLTAAAYVVGFLFERFLGGLD